MPQTWQLELEAETGGFISKYKQKAERANSKSLKLKNS